MPITKGISAYLNEDNIVTNRLATKIQKLKYVKIIIAEIFFSNLNAIRKIIPKNVKNNPAAISTKPSFGNVFSVHIMIIGLNTVISIPQIVKIMQISDASFIFFDSLFIFSPY